MSQKNRLKRLYQESRPADQRHDFERDRDRILYSSALKRLAGVTQVVSAAEGHVYHNRLTHTMKVAQIGRRLAQKIRRDAPQGSKLLGIHDEVVEAAALAHDLGHPPFGHIGEYTLHDSIVNVCGDDELSGYEGNAQSFRIVNKLARRDPEIHGLNLTRATMNAILKYPWHRSMNGEKSKKWNAYPEERREFRFARRGCEGDKKCPEAQLMDWADDITFSVHDAEDFYRAGLIPLDRLVVDSAAQNEFVKLAAKKTKRDENAVAEGVKNALGFAPKELHQAYDGSFSQRGALRYWTSLLVGRFVKSIVCKNSPEAGGSSFELTMEPDDESLIAVLKQLTHIYVIDTPALAAQQHGQREMLSYLFGVYFEAAASKKSRGLLSKRFQQILADSETDTPASARNRLYARTAADVIASMTEHEVVAMHGRLRGFNSGSVREGIFV